MNQELGCLLTKIYEEIYLLSHEKHQAYRFSSIQEPVGLLSDIFQLLCRNENYIRCEVCYSILGKRGWFLPRKRFPLWKKYPVQQQNFGCVLVYRYTKERNINELHHNSMYGCENNRNSPVYRYTRTAPEFLYLLCYGTMGLLWPFVFYALVEIVIHFFDNDLSVLIHLSVI